MGTLLPEDIGMTADDNYVYQEIIIDFRLISSKVPLVAKANNKQINNMNLDKQTIEDIVCQDKRILMRVDFNVPQDKAGNITNTQRIVAAIPTINTALEKGAKSIVLMSHLGRPNGQKNANFTLKPIADKLGEILGKDVTFLSDCVGDEVEAACADPKAGSIFVLENMRFYAEEEGKGKVRSLINSPEIAWKRYDHISYPFQMKRHLLLIVCFYY